jgi:hypothetical protein
MPTFEADYLIGVCAGTPLDGAAAYGGSVHPLVVAYAEGTDWIVGGGSTATRDFAINDNWSGEIWPSPIQLVACVGTEQSARYDSCGTYTRDSDGVVGQVLRFKENVTVRVVVASTGKTLQSKTFSGDVPSCADTITNWVGEDPPWNIYGSSPEDSAINTWVTAVSIQKVK